MFDSFTLVLYFPIDVYGSNQLLGIGKNLDRKTKKKMKFYNLTSFLLFRTSPIKNFYGVTIGVA